MDPSDLSLPVKFHKFRPGQEDAVIWAATTEKRFALLSMPTGGGKSAVYMGLAGLTGGRTLVLTGTKGLQQQLVSDFKSMGLVEIKGRNNYQCVLELPNKVGCDEGPCTAGIDCEMKPSKIRSAMAGCEYYDAVRIAKRSRLVVANYSYWMTMSRYGDPDSLGEFDNLILDEAHTAPDALADFCAIHFSKKELLEIIDSHLPPLTEGKEVWADWARQKVLLVEDEYRKLEERMRLNPKKYKTQMKRIIDLGQRLRELSRADQWKRVEGRDVNMPGMATDWVAEATPNGAMFSPVWAHNYAEGYLFRNIPKVLLVSATLQPTAARYLGIARDKYEFKETASTFNVKKRPFIWVPTVGLSRNMTTGEERIWLNKIDAIIGARLDRNGIIHARSYDRAATIVANSRHRAIMLTHKSFNTREVVEQFKRRGAPCVFVSPSMDTGWDFPYEQCEYQIIAKVPFLDTRSAIIKARAKSDKKFLNYATALTLIQQNGRGMRAEDDQCETFVIDDNISWFMNAAKEFFPQWFRAAYVKAQGIPAPLPKLRRK